MDGGEHGEDCVSLEEEIWETDFTERAMLRF
jgi:hypothetical protein